MELAADHQQEIRQATTKYACCDLFRNLYCGLRVFSFRRSGVEQVVASNDQIFWLFIFYSITILVTSYLITPNPVFDLYGLQYLSVELLIIFLIGFFLTKITGRSGCFRHFLALYYSLAPIMYLILYAGLPNLPLSIMSAAFYVYLAWVIAIIFFIIFSLADQEKFKTIFIVLLWMMLSYSLANASPSFWYEDSDYNQEDEAYYSINQEQVYYNQFSLLSETLSPIRPGVEGITDLFFIGFGSDAYQDVFMKEIGHVQRFMDQQLGTTERSIALINNVQTIDTIPLASSSNLNYSLNHIGKKMNREEDVVFLYLTSHGSQEHDLSVNMWQLSLNNLRPEDIREYLDSAKIRWRIILVSACYSGGFIEPLIDDYTLVLTAAAADKTSFGCSNENEFTYFGEALFKQAPKGSYQFLESFKRAIAEIQARELKEELPPSNPQLFIGKQMKTKLSDIEQHLTRYSVERFSDRESLN